MSVGRNERFGQALKSLLGVSGEVFVDLVEDGRADSVFSFVSVFTVIPPYSSHKSANRVRFPLRLPVTWTIEAGRSAVPCGR